MLEKTADLFPPANGPDFDHETAIINRGGRIVCGVDEVGRGPLAGPVVAAAVVLDPEKIPDGLHDSKKLSEDARERLYPIIMESSEVALGSVSARTIDLINIRAASLHAMQLAVLGLARSPDHALIDGNTLPDGLPCQASTLVKGDSRSLSIAAASIVAKVVRDRMMAKADLVHPRYGFVRHKGYGTKAHMEALNAYGPCPLHRMTFAPVAAVRDRNSVRQS